MYAETIDTGATVSVLRAFGPPDVVELDDFPGNDSVELAAEGFWTVVQAVYLSVLGDADISIRVPQLTWRALEQAPFAIAVQSLQVSPAALTDYCFAVNQQQSVAGSGDKTLTGMPEIIMLPGWTLTIHLDDGVAGDACSGIRCYVQRYQLIDVDDLNGR